MTRTTLTLSAKAGAGRRERAPGKKVMGTKLVRARPPVQVRMLTCPHNW